MPIDDNGVEFAEPGAPRHCDITWLGQAGFLLEFGQTRLLIDPWASAHEGRLIPPPPAACVARIDAVCVTHEHLDHFDATFLDALAEQDADVQLILPAPIADNSPASMRHWPAISGTVVTIGPVTIEAVSAWHSDRVEDGYTTGDGRYLGYLITCGGTTLYHAGDTIVTRELIDALDDRCIDVALLPSNGRDYFREEQDITGNMNANEAIALARRIGARLVIPYHWDGFAGNTSSPGALSNEANGEGPHVLVLQRFAPFRLSVKQK